MTLRRHRGVQPAVPLEQLAEQIGSVGAVPHILQIDLAVAQTDVEYNIAADVIMVWMAPTISDQITIKINDQSGPAIPFVMGSKLRTPFTKVFISVPGTGAGTMYLMYGMGAMIDMAVTAQDVPGAMAGMLTALQAIQLELQGSAAAGTFNQVNVGVAAVQVMAANANRIGCIVTADPTNANAVYLSFDNTVAANKFYANFAAGSFDSVPIHDYRGAIFAIAGGAGNAVGYGEW